MAVFDIIISIPLLWAAYQGFKKGLIIEIASIIALIFGIYGAIGFSDFTDQVLKNYLNIQSSYNKLLAFAITFIAIVIAVFFLAKLLEKVVKLASLGLANKLAGAFFSITKIVLILSAIIAVINNFDKSSVIFNSKLKEQSVLYSPLEKIVPILFPSIKNLINKHSANHQIKNLSDKEHAINY
jgi:membrane protein required for colicin V production